MRRLPWLLGLLASPLLAVNVFNFSTLPGLSAASYVNLKNRPANDLPKKFILCTSHRQNMFDDSGFFHMLDSEKRPWLTWVFLQQGRSGAIQLWMVTGDSGLNFLVGDIHKPKLKVWYHICVSIDSGNGTALTMVNGDQVGKKIDLRMDFLGKMPETLQDRLVLGCWVATWGSAELLQFDGSVALVRLFSWGFHGQESRLSKEPCGHTGDLMDWGDMEWQQMGGGVSSNEDTWAACKQHLDPSAWLVLPEAVNQVKAIRTCELLGNGQIMPVNNQSTLVGNIEFFEKVTPGSCNSFWTPLSDEGHEGQFRSLEDDSSSEFLPWADGQPNGATVENSVILGLEKRAYFDVQHDYGHVCFACKIPIGLGLQLRGACKSTFLGMNRLVFNSSLF